MQLTARLETEMKTYTYDRRYAAHMGNEVVTIPDEVAADQRAWDREGTAFPAVRGNGDEVMVRLDGEAYGLHTPGTGDPIVVAAT